MDVCKSCRNWYSEYHVIVQVAKQNREKKQTFLCINILQICSKRPSTGPKYHHFGRVSQYGEANRKSRKVVPLLKKKYRRKAEFIMRLSLVWVLSLSELICYREKDNNSVIHVPFIVFLDIGIQGLSDQAPLCLRLVRLLKYILKILFTHSLCYIYLSQFIHHILFNVSANQSLYQESFSFDVT